MSNNEQKAWGFWIGMLLIILVMSIAASCGKKPMIGNDIKETDKSTEVTNVSKVNNTSTDRNKAINDSLIILISKLRTAKPECDSICQEALDNVLEQLNRKVTSGDNSYRLYYDKYKSQLVINARLAETVNQLKESKKDSIGTKLRIITKRKTITIRESFVPWYWKYSAYLGWVFAAFIIWKTTVKIRSWLKPSIT